MPSVLSNKLVVTGLVLLLAACARSAPDMPKTILQGDGTPKNAIEQFDSNEKKLSCKEIDTKLADIREQTSKIEQTIQSRRGDNQAAVYFGAFFPPAYLAANDNDEEMEALDEHQKSKDLYIALKSAKRCPALTKKG